MTELLAPVRCSQGGISTTLTGSTSLADQHTASFLVFPALDAHSYSYVETIFRQLEMESEQGAWLYLAAPFRRCANDQKFLQ